MDILGLKETNKRINLLEKELAKLKKTNDSQISHFAELRKELQEIAKRSPDFERDARQSAKKATEYKNKAYETLEVISKIVDQIQIHNEEVRIIKGEFEEAKSDVDTRLNEIELQQEEVIALKSDIVEKIEEVNLKVEALKEIFNEYPDLDTTLEQLNDSVSQVEENEEKSSQLLKAISSRKNEVDKIHREIFGFEQKNEDNEETSHVPGVKDELENAYVTLNKQLKDLVKELNALESDTKSSLSEVVTNGQNRNIELAKEWEQKHEEINQKIKNLLPNALTAGLSYAFSEKKVAEDNAYDKHKAQFGKGISGLVIVSLIPFIVSIYFLVNNIPLDKVINKIPRIVLAIVPLYLPVLWLAFSSSKKMNLSKRLIEEYSHKEVLSKTFEGLSSQIDGLTDESISSELRIKLLQNFMQVYSENPGKLISNYETSDHPIMEVLDQSYKLESAVEKLKKIPGLDKVSKILESKSDKILSKGEEMVEKGLENLSKLEEEQTEV